MWRNGLRDNTLDVFEQVSRLNCIKDLYLCGGTGISLLLQHRQSEDLDFEMLNYRGDNRHLDASNINNELVSVFPECKREILGPQHIQYYIGNHVKLSFFEPKNRVPAARRFQQGSDQSRHGCIGQFPRTDAIACSTGLIKTNDMAKVGLIIGLVGIALAYAVIMLFPF